ncbi:MAG: translation initiation factor IF-2 [Pseudomonadota bacterium]
MSDTKSGQDNSTAGPRKTLSLRRGGGTNTVRQNFSHGRSNSVVVETKKRRFTKPGDSKDVFAPKVEKVNLTPKPAEAEKAAPAPKPAEQAAQSRLSASELEARTRALEEAKQREVQDQARAREEAERRAQEEEQRRIEREAEEKRLAEEAAHRAEEEKAQREREAQEEAERIATAEAEAATAQKQSETGAVKKAQPAPAVLREAQRPKSAEPAKPSRGKGDDNRRRTKLTLSNALDDSGQRGRSLASMRRRREKEKRAQTQTGPREKVVREVTIPDTITIQELANRMAERVVDVIKLLMQQGQLLKPGDIIDADSAQLIAEEMGHTVVRVSEADVEIGLEAAPDKDEDLQSRPPIVTVMGHVDHGKTSLLDALRKTNVVRGEAGGITQHIGAYQVESGGQKISFIDTPGHAAFTAMRARGASITDIAILVVAADDGVMPQTIESINHAKAADVPIIVAINKMDLPAADPNRVRTELLQHDVFVESMGGDILEIEVSALKGTNLDTLLETIVLQSEILELKANPDRSGEAVVVEAKLERGRGAVATVIVQNGTLKVGDIAVAGNEWGRVRALIDDHGKQIKSAGPATPVEVLGLSGAPAAGEALVVVDNEARAREVAEYRQRVAREKAVAAAAGSRGSLEQMMSNLQSQGASEAPMVIKGDTRGSVEAIAAALEGLGTDEVKPRIVHSAVGGITEADVTLAVASKTPIIGFNVRANKQAKDLAEREGIEIRYYSIIYDLIDDVKDTLSGLLAPERRETFLGYAEILEIFNVSKVGKVAGCLITEGKVERGMGVRLLRDDVVIHEGELSTLKRFKDEVAEVPSGQECGMAFKNYQDMRKGDVIECFRVEMIERSL